MFARRMAGACTVAILIVGITSFDPASGQGLCKEACYRWCDANRPTDGCRSDCVRRPTCVKQDAVLCKEKCYAWCKANKPGRLSCLGDCDGRKSC